LCTFKDTARILAGFPDEREGAVEAGGSAGPASLIGLRLAKGESVHARVVHPRGGGAPQDQPPAEHLSSHDAPQDTSASDPSHPAGPAAEEGE
jgi:NADH-quinone oxidoreductase subunit E